MKPVDLFHACIVADDPEAAAELSDLFGYEWTPEYVAPSPVRLASGDRVVEIKVRYSTSAPRLEIIRSIPGTIWVPATGAGAHHLGYWSDDLAADSAKLEQRGYAEEMVGLLPDGTPYSGYYRSPAGQRVELLARVMQPIMEQLFAGERPSEA